MEEEIFGIIYKATNKVNRKMYIGQTTWFLDKRIYFHIYNALSKRDNMYFHKAIKKHGIDNFVWEVIKECNSLEELNKAEIEMIKKHNTFENGYNLSEGGEGQSGFKHSEEAKKKMSKARKGSNGSFYGKFGKNHSRAKKYVIMTPNGKKIFVHGIRDFCKNYKKEKLNYGNLISVAQGNRKHHKGYKCRRLYEEVIICQK
jgi:group I intron endonuclease